MAVEHRFELAVPEGWTVLDGFQGTLVTVTEPDDAVDERFAANVNVLHVRDGRGLDVRGLLDETVAQLGRLLEEGVLLDRADEDGRLLYTFRHEETGLTVDQRYVVDGAGYFVVTATTTNAGFGRRSAALAGVLESFAVVRGAS